MNRHYIHKQENILFLLKAVATGLVLAAFAVSPSGHAKSAASLWTIAVYIVVFLLISFVRNGLLVGFIRGSCVRVGPDQFPDVYDMLCHHSGKLGLRKIPSLYIMQSGGALNALALRCVGRDYVVVFSSVLEAAYQEGADAVSFIIAHELGHIKRRHISKNMLLFPSLFIPFLHSAYSRACEYTCDGIGYQLNPAGALKGLCILSVGPSLHDKVNVKRYIEDTGRARGFWVWLAEKLSSHPFLPNRIVNIAAIHCKAG